VGSPLPFRLRFEFGRRNPDQTADDVHQDRSTGPNKAAILSALAAFGSDDDERDDTYDVADVGGTPDSAAPGNNAEEDKKYEYGCS
jgi:activating signal cointegrator complex subunit 2